MASINGGSPAQRMAGLINSFQTNIGGRGITAKVFSVGAKDENSFPEDRVQIVLHSYERDTRVTREVENALKKALFNTLGKIKEQYEDTYLESVELIEEGPVQVANDALGFGFAARGGGSFMMNADQQVRSFMVRVVQNFKVETENNEE